MKINLDVYMLINLLIINSNFINNEILLLNITIDI